MVYSDKRKQKKIILSAFFARNNFVLSVDNILQWKMFKTSKLKWLDKYQQEK